MWYLAFSVLNCWFVVRNDSGVLRSCFRNPGIFSKENFGGSNVTNNHGIEVYDSKANV